MRITQKTTSFLSKLATALFLLLTCSLYSAKACTCVPSQNLNLCQLGDEANAGQNSNFLAVVELTDSTMAGGLATFSVEVIELLAGTLPTEDIFLVQLGGASCGQYQYIELGVRGVLSGNLMAGKAFPSFCELQKSFFRMNMDTVFVPLYDNVTGFFDHPTTLTKFRSNDCEEVSELNNVMPIDEIFSLSYSPQTESLRIVSLDPAIRLEELSINLFASNGRHLLEARPAVPIDVSTMPPGMYAILIRDEQRAWSKSFVKPN